MTLPVRRLTWDPEAGLDALLEREWLVANARGGYAAGTIAGVPTRRFHGLLVASLPAPVGRAVMLGEVAETAWLPDGAPVHLAGYERDRQTPDLDVARVLCDFRLEGGLPVWRFDLGPPGGRFVLEKRIHLVHTQNTTVIRYRLVEAPAGGALRVELRPYVSFRPHEGPVAGPDDEDYDVVSRGDDHEIRGPAPFPPLRLRISGERTSLALDPDHEHDVRYRVEQRRGYDWLGATWSPGLLGAALPREGEIALIASTESWDAIEALAPSDAALAETRRRARLVSQARADHALGVGRDRADDPRRPWSLVDELVLAADEFIIRPPARRLQEVQAAAEGDDPRSVIAGYHWFTDWGRDTMIALEGLTLVTSRHLEAGYILRTFARYVQDGLIPNMFPEGESGGLYHTADATLWFFHALDRYTTVTGDRLTLRSLLPMLREVVEAHRVGTRFGIHVDPSDGLLSQGQEGTQLTWMDAKVDGWVVTPRRGKAVEINALWFNALALLARWLREEDGERAALPIREARDLARDTFNRRFWYAAGEHLYDVVDGPDGGADASLRPNQIFAVSLPNPVLEPSRWARVVDVVERELLTPVGLRSLARSDASYRPRYDGDLRSRDAAYHQGTVWSWLIGPFVDAWLRVHPGRERAAARFLDGFGPHLDDACVGSVSEIFDAEPPFRPRGCVAQAWGVAEVLRSFVKTGGPGRERAARPGRRRWRWRRPDA